ncbi:MAG: serine/threonine-protein kinase [Pseudoxanthomonas sp.]
MTAGHDDGIDWTRVEALFPDLLELPPAQRPRFLDRHCRGNDALRRELEAMLAASEGASVLDQSPQVRAQPGTTPADDAPLAADTRVGAWRIVRMVGRGGMGEVYLAERAEGGFTQRAAIKLLHAQASQHAERFEEERRILAQLTHPNIARLLDGGIHEGRAWMAMEYIAGSDIAMHCRANALPLQARLKLFHQACAAVAYAHAALVIHRDLKPSNIMVSEGGQVKLLDFGIAKLIDPHAMSSRITHATPFTPDHAAPEQIEGGPVTTAVDIYALGVVLYELLCGRLPWSFGDTPLSRAVDRLLREDPAPPSRAAADALPGSLPARELEGDLDAITARCLRRLPQDRYPTVQALQEDLDRRAQELPVRARDGGRRYRMRLWLRRNRMLAAVSVLACVSVLTGLGGALWQAREARREAARAEQVKEFVLSVFREQDPFSRDDETARLPSQLVNEGIRALDQRLGGDPELRGELLDDLGEIQANLGDLEGAHRTLLDALKERSRHYGNGSTQAIQTERKLATVEMYLGNHPQAAERARHVIAVLGAKGIAHSADAARAKRILAYTMINGKQREQALPLVREAVAELRASLGPRDPETLDAAMTHAQLLTQLRHDQEAEVALRDVVAQVEAGHGIDSAQLVAPLIALAGALRQAQRLEDADPVYARALAIARRHLGARHLRLAGALSRYGALKVQRDDYAAAQTLFDQAEAAMPAEALSELAQLLTNRGRLHLAQDHADAAERDYRRAFELRRKTNGDDDGVTWFVASQWGRALALQGKLGEAERIQRDALQRLHGILGAQAYQNALLLDALAETLMEARRYGEAESTLRHALALTAKEYPQTHPVYLERAVKLNEAKLAGKGHGQGIGGT